MAETAQTKATELTRRFFGLSLLTILLRASQTEIGPLCLNWPVFGGGMISQRFSSRHYGIDIAAPKGTALVSVANGKITALENENNNIDHALGIFIRIATEQDNNNYTFTYAHLRYVPNLTLGQDIRAGQFVGRVGMTGNTTGPHLHLESAVETPLGEKVPLDPLQFFSCLTPEKRFTLR